MKTRLTSLCLMAMMGTVMVVSKEALAFLPNVELVSLLTILFSLIVNLVMHWKLKKISMVESMKAPE